MKANERKVILSQSEGWDLSLTKNREERYKRNFKMGRDGYIRMHKTDEIQEMWANQKEGIELKTDFVWSEETGPLTHIYKKVPMRMLIDNERISMASRFKKFLYIFLQEMMYTTWYEKIGILLSIKKLRNIYLESVNRGIAEYMIDSKFVPPAVKEIKRVIDKVLPGIGKFEYEGYYSDAPCYFIENDTAYRYRTQDILTEADKKQFVKQGGKIISFIRLVLWIITKQDKFLYKASREIMRLANILLSREINKEELHWGKLPKLLAIAFQISPYYRGKLCDFIQELDIEKVKLDSYDKYWAYGSREYDYNGMPYNLRAKIR